MIERDCRFAISSHRPIADVTEDWKDSALAVDEENVVPETVPGPLITECMK